MEITYTPYIIITLAVAAICLFLAVYAWTRHGRADEAVPLALLLLMVTWMLVAYAFGLTSLDLETKLFWSKIEYTGVVFSPLLLLVFTVYRIARKDWLTYQHLTLLIVIPVVSLLLMWTTEWHGLMWDEYSIRSQGPPVRLEITYGAFFWVAVSYSYMLVMIAMGLLIRFTLNSPPVYRWQNISFLIAIGVPLIGNIIGITGIATKAGVGLWPFLLAVSGIIMSIAFFGLRLLNIVPIARDAVVKVMSDAVLVLDKHNNVVDINPSAERMLGIVPLEVLGRQVNDVLQGRLEAGYLNGKSGEMLTEITYVNGYEENLYEVQIIPLWGRHGGSIGRLLVLSDATQRKRSESNLRESEEKLRYILESVPEGIIISDSKGILLDISESVVQMCGYDFKAEIIGRKGIELIAERDRRAFTYSLKKVMEKGKREIIRCVVERKDGSEFSALVSPAVLRDAEGRPTGLVIIMADVTEQQKMQEQLMLADRLASIGQLASGIAHELNNPLTSVIGFSEMLLENELSNEIRDDLEIVDREARRAAEIIKGLLTFVRTRGTEKSLVDINNVMQEVLQLRSYEQKVNKIKVDKRFAPDLPQVMINGAQIQQVLMNLIINAEQSMLESHGRGNLITATERDGNMVRISISDDGNGISSDNMKKLFTPFFTTKEVGKGTGLGLSICHGIVTEHGGRIFARSGPGKGASFIIELPAGIRAGKPVEETGFRQN